MKRYAFLAALLCASLLCNRAELTGKKQKLEEDFRRVPVPELGAWAAQLIRSTPANEREETAVAAVETILQRNPAAAVTVVAAISKAAPETAPAIVAAANRVAPASAEHVVIAARNAAPAFRDSIDLSSSRVIPSRNTLGHSESGKGEGDQGNSGNNAGNSDRGGEIRHDDTLPNGKPFPGIRSHPPHPEHPEHPAHPPHPIKYNRPHDHDHDGDDDHGHGEGNNHGRDEHGHDRD